MPARCFIVQPECSEEPRINWFRTIRYFVEHTTPNRGPIDWRRVERLLSPDELPVTNISQLATRPVNSRGRRKQVRVAYYSDEARISSSGSSRLTPSDSSSTEEESSGSSRETPSDSAGTTGVTDSEAGSSTGSEDSLLEQVLGPHQRAAAAFLSADGLEIRE